MEKSLQNYIRAAYYKLNTNKLSRIYRQIKSLMPTKYKIRWRLDDWLFIDILHFLNTDFSSYGKEKIEAVDGEIHSIHDPEYWDKQWKHWGDSKKVGKNYYWDIPELLCKYKAKRILEIGCGTGYMIGDIQDKCTQVEKYVGIDISTYSIEEAKKRIHKPEFEARVENIENIDKLFDTFQFDAIISADVIEHLPKKIFSKLIKLLVDNNIPLFLFATPYLNHVPTPVHINCFSKTKMKKLLKKYYHLAFSKYNDYKEFLIFGEHKQYE